MRIGEAARTVGLPGATIRNYEHEAFLDSAARSGSNYWSYDPEVIEKLGLRGSRRRPPLLHRPHSVVGLDPRLIGINGHGSRP